MTTESSEIDGTVSVAELAYLRRRARGVAAVITSCAYIDEAGKTFRGIGASQEFHVPSLSAIADVIHDGNARAILQLYDGGRLASQKLNGGLPLRGPSAVASSRPGAMTPEAMTSAEVEGIIEAFTKAAERGVRAGFDGIELHGANHYLLHQFFSPRSNRRSDDWGGSAKNRRQFSLALTRAIRSAIGPRVAIGYRVTPYEHEQDQGISLDETLDLARDLQGTGVDYVHVSLDNYISGAPLREDRRTEIPFASRDGNPVERIVESLGARTPVVAVGGVRSTGDALRMRTDGAAAIAVGRALIIDPDWFAKVESGDEKSLRTALPHNDSARILNLPQPMVDYMLSRPGWVPVET
jgi:2,4-dienoyl-CoA reductase-like NADH-dependent reductase (Old Yellow Enzyme family)